MPSLFKQIVAVLCLVFALCFAAPNAHADSFSVAFTNYTTVPTAPDVTFPSPTLDITWEGADFTVTLPSSMLPTDDYRWYISQTVNTGKITIEDDTHFGTAVSNTVSESGTNFTGGLGSVTLPLSPPPSRVPSHSCCPASD